MHLIFRANPQTVGEYSLLRACPRSDRGLHRTLVISCTYCSSLRRCCRRNCSDGRTSVSGRCTSARSGTGTCPADTTRSRPTRSSPRPCGSGSRSSRHTAWTWAGTARCRRRSPRTGSLPPGISGTLNTMSERVTNVRQQRRSCETAVTRCYVS